MKKILVIGGGAAGAKAASKAKRLEPKNHVELYTRGENVAYSLCGLPYYIEGSVKDINKLIVRTPEEFIQNGIQIFLNSELQEIYPDKNCVLINDNHIFYDELILALGAYVNIPNIENIDANNIFTLRSLKDGINIRNKMLQAKSVLIVGAGYISMELIEAFIANGLSVSVVEINESFAHDFDEDFSKSIQKIISDKCKDSLKLYFKRSVVRVNTDEKYNFKSVTLDDEQEIFADFCVLATGAGPNSDIAKRAGINLGINGAISVDNRMRTNIPNIFACGDCAQKYSIVTRQPVYIGLGTIANKEGRVAAINATSSEGYEIFDGVLNSTITKFFEYTISKTGLSYNQALENSHNINLEPIQAVVSKKDKASYMPGASEITIKLVADKRSGEILGAQAIGTRDNVAQRINTITSVLKSRLTVEELLHLDLPYAPPFSSSIDPILTACYKLKEQLKK